MTERSTMPEIPEPRRFGPFVWDPKPGPRHPWDFHLGALLMLVASLVVGVHETIYHELPAGKQDYPFLGLLSHFGADMLALAVVLAVMAVVFEHWRDQ